MADFYVGDEGIKIIAELTQGGAAYDLTAATVTFDFTKPDGTTVQKTASVESPPADGKASYTLESGFLDVPHIWTCVVEVAKGTEKLHAKFRFDVGEV